MDIRIPLHLFRRKSRLLAGLVTVLLLVFLSGASFVQNADAQAVIVDFTPSGLGGETVTNPTSLQFGPDGRLYVSVQSGDIYAYDVVRNAANDYDVVGVENITLVKNITNYDDDGTSTNTTNRQITGIYVTGTGVNPILYVTSSDPRIGAGGGGEDKGLDTNSGIVSKLTCTGGMLIDGNTSTCQGWDMVHLVRGLPRSEENHSVNGMQIDEANNIMYLAVGGNTNAGAPSNNFALTTEYVYAAAVVTIDLDAIETNYPIQIDGNGEAYRYDLPTLDDPTRPNVFPDGTPASEDPNDANYSPLDENDPWGGNDGLNQAKIDVGGPVQLYATGFRNLYDIVITEDNRMYGVDNGANQQWGGHPLGEADYPAETTVGLCTHEYDPNEPGSTDTGPGGDSVVNNQNGLHYIRTLEPGDLNYVQPDEMYYGGHPAPIRGNPDGAGLYTKFEERDAQNNIISSTTFWRTQILDSTDPNFETQSLPVDWPPVPLSMAYAAECDFRDSGEDDNSLSNYTDSTNGIAEYTASNFGGALQGYLLLASYNNKIYQVELSSDGKTALNCPARPPLGSTVATCSIGSAEFASNFGSTPLDVIAQGDADPFGGTVWSVTYGANSITVFEPADYDGADPIICTGADDDTIDEDGDGYTNADEIDNDSNPCSGSVKPTDFDQTLDYTAGDTDFLRSDLNDNDDDNDSLLDDVDPFPLDCSNGEGGSCAAIASGFLQIGSGLQFFNETGYGFGTIGLTGLMTNETTDYLNQISNVNNELVFGGTAGIYTDVSVGDTTPVGATNNLVNAWQFSLDTDVNTAPFQIETQMNGPLFNALQGGESAWQGLQLGSGDQDNFIMFVLETDDVGTRFRVYAENNGTEIYNVTETAPAAVLDPGSIRMYLTVNPGTGNVQASYQFVPQSGNIGALTDVGGNVTLQGEALAALQGTHTISGVPSALAVGMVANASQADPAVGASWDFFNVDTVPSSAEALVQASTNGLLGSTFNENSITITNNSSAGETITNVTFDIGGGMIPEIVFDPDGTAGDAVGRGFFPAGGSEVTTGATASFAQPYEGGFYELSIDFTNFDPGEQLVFGVDIDPISVKGGSAPGPGEAASVSGLEMAGSSVSVTYSNGETQVVELYRTQPDANSAAENVVTNAKPIAPSITMDNVSSQSIVFDAVQNVKVAADLEDTVYLLQLETAMFLEGLDGPNAPDGYNVDPWEVNSIVSISEYDATVGNGGVADIPVTLLNTDPEAGFNVFAAVVVRTLENGDIVTSDLSNYIIVKYDPAAAPESAYRVNAGAVTIPATDGGLDWTAVGDGAQSGPGYSVNNGILTGFGADSLDPSVPSYAPLALFDQEKYDPPGGAEMTWNFDVEPDTYIVRLFMANTFSGTSAVGQRIFDIAIEGTTVEQNLDLVAEFGHKVGGVKEYVVENTDGTINIEFLHGSVENPLVNAIEVAPYDIGAETPINVTGIPNQVNVEGEAADFDVAATGGDGGSLSYTAVGLPPGIGLEPTNGDIIGTIDFGAAANSPYTVTITVDDNDFTSVDAVSVSFQWTVSDGSQPAQAVLYRVNAGGPSIAAPDGSLPAWSADTDTANSPFLSEPGSNNTFIAGDPITFDTSIPASAPEAMLQASRFDFAGGNEMAYSFPVDVDTEVEIRLYFAETFLNQNDGNPGTDGSRIFDIAVDGTVPAVFNDIDQEASFGHDVGFMLSFQTVSDGAVDLEFLRFAENPSIKGIEILKTIP
ncbi:MAG: malectin domain-containing carbohydrate-binding protein, partial [Chloroflexota bacterium]